MEKIFFAYVYFFFVLQEILNFKKNKERKTEFMKNLFFAAFSIHSIALNFLKKNSPDQIIISLSARFEIVNHPSIASIAVIKSREQEKNV